MSSEQPLPLSADASVDGGVPPLADDPSRPRYGRRRGRIPMGDTFISRLGPLANEPFAAIDDPEEMDPPDIRPAHETPIEALRFVALDCETTGQTPHRMVELGAVAFTIESHLISFETLVHCNDRINPYARRIHGITSEGLSGAPGPDAVLTRFRRFARGAVLVEHSADAFDTRLISRTMQAPLDADNLDTSRLAAAIWDLKDTIGLERLCERLQVHHRRPHHALADAEATAECFIGLVELGQQQFGWRTLADLLSVGQPPPPRPHDQWRPRRRRRSHRPAGEANETSQQHPDGADPVD